MPVDPFSGKGLLIVGWFVWTIAGAAVLGFSAALVAWMFIGVLFAVILWGIGKRTLDRVAGRKRTSRAGRDDGGWE